MGIFASCCSLRGKAAARELEALDQDSLCERMFEDMTCEAALTFADDLRAAADSLERNFANVKQKPKGAGWNGTWDAKKKEWDWQSYSTFEEALASIREAARWYEKIAKLGFGVTAWY